nr:MAG TPA: hypothetical protein [Caudoviricetes sp.]
MADLSITCWRSPTQSSAFARFPSVRSGTLYFSANCLYVTPP